jgi:acyl-CoA reductase-like NAD-dependent aldehyde dehydrogenase
MANYATINPATGDLVREFPTISDDEADRALIRAHEAYLSWRYTDLSERAKLLGEVAALFRDNAIELAKLMTLEMGKSITQAKGEVALVASIFEYYATKGPDLLADEELDIAGTGRAIVRTAPIGALLGIMPWNFPYYQVARFVAPNLLLGNTIVLKHAGNCPQQALRIGALLTSAGAPDGVYQNVFVSAAQVATMIASPLLQGVSLTGSERAGSAVGELAGRHMKKCVLELGGSDPLIVLPDADLPSAVHAAVTHAPIFETQSLPSFPSLQIPAVYLTCRDDRALPPGAFHPGQSSRLRAPELIEIEGDHESLLTAPQRLADALHQALDALDAAWNIRLRAQRVRA